MASNVKSSLASLLSAARLMADGLKKRPDEAAKVGITEARTAELEAETAALSKLDSEQEALKAALKTKTAELGEAQKKLAESVSTLKKLVKIAVDKNDWLTFGISDKK